MDNIILYDGIYQAEVDEFRYAEAELVVASNYIDNLFFDLVRSFNDDTLIYSEADGEAKQGFFKRIWTMFKNFWKAIIDFIKGVCRKVLEILSKPFGFKMNKANNAAGAGSSGGSSERTNTDAEKIGTGSDASWSSLKELGVLMNKTIAYIKTPKTVSKEDVSKEGIISKDLFKDSIDSRTSLSVYKNNNITQNIKILEKLAAKLNIFDDKDVLESLDKSTKDNANTSGADLSDLFKEARAHKNISFIFETAKPTDNKDDSNVKRLIAIMDAGYRVIKNIMICSGKTAQAMSEIEKKTVETEAIEVCKTLYETIINDSKINNSLHTIHTSVVAQIKDEDKIFGISAKDAVALSPVYYLYSFGKNNLLGLKNEKDFIADIDSIPAVKKSQDFKVEAYDNNANLLKGEMLPKDILKLGLIEINIKPGYLIKNAFIMPASANKTGVPSDRAYNGVENYGEIIKTVLRANLEDLTKMKETYELDDINKNALKDLKDAKKVSSSAIIQGLVSNASGILKSTVKNIAELTNLTIRVDNACVSTPYIYQSVQIANAMHIYWDRICYAKDFIQKELNNNKKLQEDLGDDLEKEKTNLTQDIKTLGNNLSNIFRQKYGD